jgi:hypothetical protein
MSRMAIRKQGQLQVNQLRESLVVWAGYGPDL